MFFSRTTPYTSNRAPAPRDSLDELSIRGGQQRPNVGAQNIHQNDTKFDARSSPQHEGVQNERFDLNGSPPHENQPFQTDQYQGRPTQTFQGRPPGQMPSQSQAPFQDQYTYNDQPPAPFQEQQFSSNDNSQFSMPPFKQMERPNNDRYQGFPNANVNDPLNQKEPPQQFRQFFNPSEMESLGGLASSYDLPDEAASPDLNGLPPRESRSRMTSSRIASLGRSKSAADKGGSGRRGSRGSGDRRAKSAAAHHNDGDAYWGTEKLNDESGGQGHYQDSNSPIEGVQQQQMAPPAPYQNHALQSSPLRGRGTRRSRPSQYRQATHTEDGQPEWGDNGNNENRMDRRNNSSSQQAGVEPNYDSQQAPKAAAPRRRRDRRQAEQNGGGSKDDNANSRPPPHQSPNVQMSPPVGKGARGFGGNSPPNGVEQGPSGFSGNSPRQNSNFGGSPPPKQASNFGGNSPTQIGGGGGNSGFGAEYPPAEALDASGNPPEFAAPVQLHPCSLCGRKFNEKALAKHSKVCAKATAKRKVFNATQARVEGTEAAKFVKKGAKKEEKKPAAKKADWKQQSNALREAMEANKEIAKAKKEGRDLSTLPPPKPSAPDPSLVPCPHCGRSFNAMAAERHIPKCSDIKAKPKKLMRGAGGGMGNRKAINTRPDKKGTAPMGKSAAMANKTRSQRKR
jgi:hypothetical protein